VLDIKDKVNVKRILKHCKRIDETTKDVRYEEFMENLDIQDVVSFHLLQIGELSKKLSKEFITEYNKINWKDIKGMRDNIVHGYEQIDLDIVYNTEVEDIPKLITYCEEILK